MSWLHLAIIGVFPEDLKFEYAVIGCGLIEVWPTEELARREMRDFYNDDARLYRRVVSEWAYVD